MAADKKIDPVVVAKRLKAHFRNSDAFEKCLSDIRADRAYTKAVLMEIFKALFPKRRPPPDTIKRGELIDRIGRQRRRDEDVAAA